VLLKYLQNNNRVAAGIPYFVHSECMFYYRVCTHGGTAAQEYGRRLGRADHTEMTSANQNRQKKLVVSDLLLKF
jgi:hypothetical protein